MNFDKKAFQAKITDLSETGAGIGKVDGFTWFIEGAVPGDLVIAMPTKVKKSYGYASINDIISPSPDRVTPPCKYFDRCGGCQTQHINYAKQIQLKQTTVIDALERIGGFGEVDVLPTVGMENSFRYRNKGVYHVRNQQGKTTIGFYEKKSHRVVDIEDCLIQNESHAAILRAIRRYMKDFNITAYDEKSKKGLIKEVVIRQSNVSNQLLILFVTTKKTLNMSNMLIKLLIEAEPLVVSIYQNIQTGSSKTIFGDQTVKLYGEEYLTESLEALEFEISPLSFFQVNTPQAEKLYNYVLNFAGLSGKEVVYDLYCGTGTLAIFMASKAKQIYGVELFEPALDDARRNMKLNNIENIEWILGKSEEVILELLNQTQKPDVVVLDPPRGGCDVALIDSLKGIMPSKIVYVSCKPSTMARDLKALCEVGYELKGVQPVDMFGHSTHVETVVLMSRA